MITATTGPWGTDPAAIDAWLADGAPSGSIDLVPVPGFVASRFIPLVRHTLARCLDAAGRPGGPKIGMVLASVLGDTTTADAASEAVAAGVKPLPLLFYQSIPNSVLGHVSTEYSITGPITCLSGGLDLYGDAIETAELMLADGLDAVLVAYAELGTGRRYADNADAAAEFFGGPVVPDFECCLAVLLTAQTGDLAQSVRTQTVPGQAVLPRPVRSFLALAAAAHAKGQRP